MDHRRRTARSITSATPRNTDERRSVGTLLTLRYIGCMYAFAVGHTELAILMAIRKHQGRAYCKTIMDDFETIRGIKVPHRRMYSLLRRLREKDLVKTQGGVSPTRRKATLYALSAFGEHVVRVSLSDARVVSRLRR